MKRINKGTTAQTGQAMVEFLISMIMVMSVLLLAIVMLAKFNDVRNRTLMGARYVAWERTVWTDGDARKNLIGDPATTEGWSGPHGSAALSVSKSDGELKAEMLQRIVAGDGSLISSMDRKLTELPSSQPAMWNDYGGNPLLASADDVVVATNASANPASSRNDIAVAKWPIATTGGGQYMAQLSLPTRTLQSGTVSISVAQDSRVLKRLWPKDNLVPAFSGLTFSDTNVLMTNTWVPDGSDSNKSVISGAVPAANVALVPPARYQGLKKYAPEISDLEFGLIQQDVVPAGRLSP